LAEGALVRLNSARRARAKVSKAAGQALLVGGQAVTLMSQAAKDPERVIDGALGMSEFSRKAGLMRRALTGRW